MDSLRDWTLQLLIWCCLVGGVVLLTADGSSAQPVQHIQMDNDSFLSSSDRNYTSGLIYSYRRSARKNTRWRRWLTKQKPSIDLCASVARAQPCTHLRAGIDLGQLIYTPSDINSDFLVPGDRPYGGLLYLRSSASLVNHRQYQNVWMDVGILGPASLAAPTQLMWHKLFALPVPQGWEHQLKSEPAFNLGYKGQFPLLELIRTDEGHTLHSPPENPSIHLGPGTRYATLNSHIRTRLGTIFSDVALGALLKLGRNITRHYDPTDPSLVVESSSSPVERQATNQSWENYVFGGFDLQLVGRNVFLDGNTFRSSHRVEKRRGIISLKLGAVVRYHQLAVTISRHYRSPEFTAQDRWHAYTSIGLTVQTAGG